MKIGILVGKEDEDPVTYLQDIIFPDELNLTHLY